MSVEVKVPVLPESVADATVANWHKNPGDAVRRDENLVDLETDKVVLEVPAPCDGVLSEIQKPVGEVVTNDEILGVIEEGAAKPEAKADAKGKAKAQSEKDGKAAAPAETSQAVPKEAAKAAPESTAAEAELSPAVHRLVVENNLDPSTISGSGRDGRITKEDVLKALKQGAPPAAPAAAPSAATAAATAAGSRLEERVPMSRLRKRIAERMVQAQHTAAMLTSFNEVNLQAVMDIRRRHKAAFETRHGVRLGLMSFFVKASVDALRKHPVVNATLDEGDVVYHAYQDIGIAVATERGLVVPVLRNVDRMSFADIEKGISEYAASARKGALKLEDLQGGTFTITNGGVFGSLLSTPILNMPQSAILGMHTIKERPVVEDGQIVARPMMYIALTYDHRIVDGQDAVLFLVAVKDALEDPARLMLDL